MNHPCVAAVNTSIPVNDVHITINACQIFPTPIKSNSWLNRNNIKRKIKGSFLSKALELPADDYVVFVRKNLIGLEEELKKDLDYIWKKFKKRLFV